MPKLMDSMEDLQTTSNYGFSAVKMDDLGASEYTLVTITADVSTSVSAFKDDLEKCLKTILESCQKSPREENLMIRLVSFNHGLQELHGFKLLNSIDESDYDGILNCTGMTALYDAVYSSIEATQHYGAILNNQDYMANAIIFVITDGCDNSSSYTPSSVKQIIGETIKNEDLESVSVVLVGVGDDPYTIDELDRFQSNADINQFVKIGEATPGKLAKLAEFISQSISSTSQSLGSGSASAPLTF